MAKKVKQKSLFTSQDEVNWQWETDRIIKYIGDKDIKIVYVDLFCGAGGLSKGVDDAMHNGKKCAYVALGINHDRLAIASHRVNFPDTLHLVEDVRDVRMQPIKEMFEAIRFACPWIKVFLWVSAECTHHSKAKGGDSRDGDSRSLPEEIYRYQDAIHPEVIQVENVTEFRSWCPLVQKVTDLATLDRSEYIHRLSTADYGEVFSKNRVIWIDFVTGLTFKKSKKDMVRPWMVPVNNLKGEYFNQWRDHLKAAGYDYEDADINAADHGARTNRIRYYGQFSKNVPIQWPEPSHSKNPERHFAKTGVQLHKHLPVRPLLDFADTGDSVFTPNRIDSDQTFIRVNEGAVMFIAGGHKKYEAAKAAYEEWLNGGAQFVAPVTSDDAYLIKWNSAKPADDNYRHSVSNLDRPSPTAPTRNMIGLTQHEFLPFIVQYNNNSIGTSVDAPCNSLTKQEKFALTQVAFMQNANNGFDPASMNSSVDKPARVQTASGKQYLVQAERILPFLSNYHGTGHNCHDVDNPSPAACAADIHALVTAHPFLYRQFGKDGGGHTQSVDQPAGALVSNPNMNIINPEAWIMNTDYSNVGSSVDNPANVVNASRHHAYLVNPQYQSKGSSCDKPAPVVLASQSKTPLHLAQVIFGDQDIYGIAVYKTDSKAVRDLKKFMAVYGIKDIKMRMLKESELLQIQGFPVDFFDRVRELGVKVSTTAAKKYIGNSQEVTLAKRMTEAYAKYFYQLEEAKAA